MSGSRSSMLELMTWGEVVDNLCAEGGFKMAAVFGEGAKKLAGTENADFSEEDAKTIGNCLGPISTMIYGLFLFHTKFRCINVDRDTLIGRSEDDVIVAHRNNNLLICVVSGLRSNASCLGVVKQFMGRLATEGLPEASLI